MSFQTENSFFDFYILYNITEEMVLFLISKHWFLFFQITQSKSCGSYPQIYIYSFKAKI